MSSSSTTSSSSFRPTPSTSVASSFVFTEVAASSDRDDDDDEVASLPSISSSILDGDDLDDLARSDAQREWEASLEQLQLLLTMIIMPFAGKFLGRKFAYYSWARYMEWFHNVEIQWTGKKASSSLEAAASL